MNDPFSPWEKTWAVSLAALEILREFDYPFVISTKSAMPAEPAYLRALQGANAYVRISVTGGDLPTQSGMERGVPNLDERLRAAAELASRDIAVSLRLQPIIWGQEEAAANQIRMFASVGVKHVTAEYLKLPVERASKQYSELRRIDTKLNDRYRSLGAKLVGREYVLPADAKIKQLRSLERVARSCGVSFGYADNDLLHLNRFRSCCNAADRYLRNANFFSFNILGIIKAQMGMSQLRFDISRNEWLPLSNMFSHLNSRSRPDGAIQSSWRESWILYLREKWNSSPERGGPSSYWGIKSTDRRDDAGNLVYTHNYDVG
ncbi:hypothetical protein [Mesorhizobium sp. YM1C-6-2]|uniref:hypothetical protein n=1 Tax=Mesorhizobium sp. YM1C-6-2 TaxID=1827501 RepID=UPI0011C3AFE5|nr:hypothetical protein [Mesorhizobium sp. YM1C-6-2]